MNPDAKQVLTEWLVLAAQNGGEQAFRDLHALWRADLHRMALVRVEQSAAADEVTAEAWLAIARTLPRLTDPTCFPRWAFRIVERRCADWIRRRCRDRQREESLMAGVESPAPGPSPGDSGPADNILHLRAAIARLPGEQRQLLHLYYEAGRTVADIAEILSIPAGTVKSRLFSIRETLRQQIERQHHE